MTDIPTDLPGLSPEGAFRQRMREARTAARMTQGELSARLAELGYKLSRGAIADIERGQRAVRLNDALAISAALGVAPVNMMAPFEDPEPIDEEATRLGIFRPLSELAVGANLRLIPVVARRWIRGLQLYSDAPLEDWARYYVEQVPPSRRAQLREIQRALEAHEPPRIVPLVDDVAPKMRTPGGKMDTKVWQFLTAPPDEEELGWPDPPTPSA